MDINVKKKSLKFTKKTKTQILNEKNPLIDTMLKEDIQMTDNYIHKARKCKLNWKIYNVTYL